MILFILIAYFNAVILVIFFFTQEIFILIAGPIQGGNFVCVVV